MKEENIRRIASKNGMSNSDLFVKFFQIRFPNESDEIESYVSEWIDRFLSGNPVAHMDKKSREVYKSLIDL